MRFWKRIDPQGKTTTVESYSHDLPVTGAVEIGQAEFDAYLSTLAASPEAVAEQTKATKRAAASTRALAAIQANKTGAPWGTILHDLAVAQGWIEPE